MKKSVVKTFSFIFIITLVAKVLGLLRDMFFANYYGTGYVATAFFAATRIPTQLLDIGLGAAIASTFIPVFNKVLETEGKEKANSFANNFVNIIALIATVISVLGIIFAPQVVKLLAGGFDKVTFDLTVDLIKITFPMIIFTAIAYSFVGFLQSYGEFNIPATISAVSNIVIIVFLVLFREKFGINGVAWCMLVAWALQVLIQIPSAHKNGYRFKYRFDFKDENIKKVFVLAIPIIISTSVLPINNLVSTKLASSMMSGAVPALEYSYKLYIVLVGIFTYAIGNIIFPELSKSSANNDTKTYISIIQKGIRIMSYLIIPLTIGIIIYRTDIVSIIYQRGEFDINSTLLTSLALLFYSIGMIGFGIVEIMNKSFYAKQDAKTPFRIGIIVIIVNVLLSIILSKYIGFTGLALSTSLTSIINAILLTLFANKQTKGIVTKELIYTVLKVFISSLIMGLTVILLNNMLINILYQNMIINIIRIFIGTVGGIVMYYLFTLLLNVDESYIPINYIKNKYIKENK